MRSVLENIEVGRMRSCPIIAVRTPDQQAFLLAVLEKINGSTPDKVAPKIVWDCVRGLYAGNKEGGMILVALGKEILEEDGSADKLLEMFGNATAGDPALALKVARRFPEETLFVLVNAQRFVKDTTTMQGISNLREDYKSNGRTVVMIGAEFDLPMELQDDVILLDDERPNDAAIRAITRECFEAIEKEPTDAELEKIVDAVRGLSSFAVEQVVSLAFTSEGFDVAEAWERKRMQVNQTPGLTMTLNSGFDLSQIKGNQQVINFVTRYCSNDEERPGAVVVIDEIEKGMEGATGGDLSGTKADRLGKILGWMDGDAKRDKNEGLIGVGIPGCGKTLLARALGATFGIPTINLDTGALSGGIVGESESKARNALAMIDSVAGGRAFVIATCNRLGALPPELRRRFTAGIFFFEVPSAEEKKMIWALYAKQYRVDDTSENVDDAQWTGAEIRNCCSFARKLNCSLEEASEYIVPVAVSMKPQIEKMRELADGNFKSAAYPGTYHKPGQTFDDAPSEPPTKKSRKLSLS